MRFEALRPNNWQEIIDTTLDQIEVEGEWHRTERLVMSTGEFGAPSIAVSILRACAVVLAAEVERLRVDEDKLRSTMVAFFIDKYHVDHLISVLNHGGTVIPDWEPDAGQRAQAEADAQQIIERLRK